MDGWLLGHIHKPTLGDSSGAAGAGPCGYLGSLVGLDPSESGPHGPWLIHVSGSGQIAAEQLAIAPLRWEHLDLEVKPEENEEDLGDRLLDEAEKAALEIQRAGPAPRALGLRFRLVGPTRHYDAIQRAIERNMWIESVRVVGETVVFLNEIESQLRLALDLDEIAKGNDPPGILARKLVSLTRGGNDVQALLNAARGRLGDVAADGRWRPVTGLRDAVDPVSDTALTSLLVQTGTTLLNKLLAQRDAGAGGSS
jgi:hypothetical protein